MLDLLSTYLLAALPPDTLTQILTVSVFVTLGLATVHVALTFLQGLDKSDGVTNWPGISQALTTVSFALQVILAFVGLTYTRGKLKPVLVVLFEKLRAQFGGSNIDDQDREVFK